MHNKSEDNKTLKRPSCGGSIRQRPDGRYEGRVSINGKRKSVYGKSYTECVRKMKQLYGLNTDSLYQYASKWIIENKLDYIEPSSYDRLETMIKIQIAQSDLSDLSFDKITAKQLKEFLMQQIAPKDQGGMGYGYSTMKKVYELLKDMYSFAYH